MNPIKFRCTNVRTAARGPEDANLQVTLQPVVTNPVDPSVVEGGPAVKRGNVILDVPNESGQNSDTFREGEVYALTVAPSK